MSDLIELIDTLNVMDIEENEKPKVFWIDDTMYVNDNAYDRNHFTFSCDLYYAWKFAKIFDLDFDYDCEDEVVLNLGKTIMNEFECEDEKEKMIDIDKYFDDIKNDFNDLLVVDWNNTEWQMVKRYIVQCMEENPYGCCIGGSATFISKWLWETINEHIGDTEVCGHIKTFYADENVGEIEKPSVYKVSKENTPKLRDNHPNKKILQELRDKYLEADYYDIIKFADELHKVQETEQLTFKELLHSLMKEKFQDNDNPKIYVEIEKNIEAITKETPNGNIYEITGYRLDDDEDIYLSIE